jgi:hypothetical protein
MADREGNTVSQALNQRQASLNTKSSVSRDAIEFECRQGVTWIDSSIINRCVACQCKFSLTNRKHHCRECGQVFCGNCSCYKVVVDGKMKRVSAVCPYNFVNLLSVVVCRCLHFYLSWSPVWLYSLSLSRLFSHSSLPPNLSLFNRHVSSVTELLFKTLGPKRI